MAWLTMLASALLLPISFITVLMLLAGSYGTGTADVKGFLSVVVAPPLTLLAGFGLLRRWRWARYYLMVLLAILIAVNVSGLTRGGATTAQTIVSGVPTTTMHSGVSDLYSLPVIMVCALALVLLLTPSVRREFSAPGEATPPPLPRPEAPQLSVAPEPGWRVGHRGRDSMYYEEWHDGAWQRIEIQGEMLLGRAHHVIYFFPPDRWQSYPGWARNRRDEIIARVKSGFPEPDYEYYGDGAQPPPWPTAQPSTVSGAPAHPVTTTRQWVALFAFIVIFWGLAAGAGLMVKKGIESGATYLPLKRPSLQRVVTREAEPATFWLVIAVYAGAGVLAAGGGFWFCREARRLRRH